MTIDVMPAKKPTSIYQLKITLRDIRPPIWRSLEVPNNIRLCCLHDALQIAMGWTDSHLHQFEKAGKYWGVPKWYEHDDIDVIDECRVSINSLLKSEGDTVLYTYDFGDNWRHDVVLEKILPGKESKPVCIVGERHCPPEDVGGVSGYERFLEVIFDPSHEDHNHYVSWAGGWFNAEEFNLLAVNDALAKKRYPVRHRR